MSPSKKANRSASSGTSKGVQQELKKTAARSSRVPAERASAKTKQTSTKPNMDGQKPGVSSEAATLVPVTDVAETAPSQATKSSSLMINILRVLALLAVIGITYYIVSMRDRVDQFKEYGYVGVFVVALLANATVLIPAPGLAIIYAMGAVFNPLGVGLAAGTGGALGELSGYLAGFSGQAVIERTDIYVRIRPWVDKYGGWAILFFSAIPNPFFDVAGIAAGIAKMPFRTFLFFTWIGQLIKMTLFAVLGSYSIAWITRFIH